MSDENQSEDEPEGRTWQAEERDRQIKKAEERGDALPIFSGMMAAFFGKD